MRPVTPESIYGQAVVFSGPPGTEDLIVALGDHSVFAVFELDDEERAKVADGGRILLEFITPRKAIVPFALEVIE